MTKIIIPRSGDAALRIDGETLAHYDTQRLAGKDANRWYEYAIYRLADGRLAWHVGYRTQWQGESDYDWGGIAAGNNALIDVLRQCYLPPRVGFPPGPQYAARQESLLTDLDRHRDHAVSVVLDRAAITATAEDVRDPGDDSGESVFDHVFLRRWAESEIGPLHLTEDEACAICDANNGGLLDEFAELSVVQSIWDSAEQNHHDEKWDIHVRDLCNRINAAGSGARFALAWACAQFWRRSQLPMQRALAESGFISAVGVKGGIND